MVDSGMYNHVVSQGFVVPLLCVGFLFHMTLLLRLALFKHGLNENSRQNMKSAHSQVLTKLKLKKTKHFSSLD